MSVQILLVISMTFIITFIGTLAYAVRIVGVRTGKIAISFSLFNILILVSRLASTVQAPLLTKYMEVGRNSEIVDLFYLILLVGLIATIVGAISIPTFQRVFSVAVNRFSIERSVPKVLIHGFSKAGIKHFRTSIALPKSSNIKGLDFKDLPFGILFLNVIAVAVLTVGIIAPIYAGVLEPSLRATSVNLSGVINGFSTMILFIFVDPYLSVRTDDVIDGKLDESEFRRIVVATVGTKIVGAGLAIPLLYPAANVIVFIAKLI